MTIYLIFQWKIRRAQVVEKAIFWLIYESTKLEHSKLEAAYE